jgi:hypothetical protein
MIGSDPMLEIDGVEDKTVERIRRSTYGVTLQR